MLLGNMEVKVTDFRVASIVGGSQPLNYSLFWHYSFFYFPTLTILGSANFNIAGVDDVTGEKIALTSAFLTIMCVTLFLLTWLQK